MSTEVHSLENQTEPSKANNKQKVDINKRITKIDLIADKYVLLQKGKKNYFIISVSDI